MAISSGKVQVSNRALARIGETVRIESLEDDTPAANACDTHFDDLLRELLELKQWPFATREAVPAQIGTQSITYAGDASQTNFEIPFAFIDPALLVVVEIQNDASEVTLAAVTDYTLNAPDVAGETWTITTIATAAADESIKISYTPARTGWQYLYSIPSDMVTPIGLLATDTKFNSLPYLHRAPFEIVPDDSGEGLIMVSDLDSADFAGLQYIAMIDTISILPRMFIDALTWRLAVELAHSIKKDQGLASYCWGQFSLSVERAGAAAFNVGHEGEEPLTPSISVRDY